MKICWNLSHYKCSNLHCTIYIYIYTSPLLSVDKINSDISLCLERKTEPIASTFLLDSNIVYRDRKYKVL